MSTFRKKALLPLLVRYFLGSILCGLPIIAKGADFPDKPITKRPAEVRMGKGKGAVDSWVMPVRPGRVLYEVEGVQESVALEALRLAGYKLPMKTRVIKRGIVL